MTSPSLLVLLLLAPLACLGNDLAEGVPQSPEHFSSAIRHSEGAGSVSHAGYGSQAGPHQYASASGYGLTEPAAPGYSSYGQGAPVPAHYQQVPGFDAHSWTQANANLFQQTHPQQFSAQQQPTQYQGQQKAPVGLYEVYPGYGPQQQQQPPPPQPHQQQLPPQQQQVHSFGQPGVYGPQGGQNALYGPQTTSVSQQQNVYQPQTAPGFGAPAPQPQTFFPPGPHNAYGLVQQPDQSPFLPDPSAPTSIYQPQPQPAAPAPPTHTIPQQQVAPHPEPQPEPNVNALTAANLQQYAQYLEMLQKHYGIKLPEHPSAPQPQQPQPQPPTQIHQSVQAPQPMAPQISASVQGGTYTVAAGGAQPNLVSPWQSQVQAVAPPSQPHMPHPQPVQPQPQPQPQPQAPSVSVDMFPGGDYSTNAVVEPHQPPPAPHILLPQPQPIVPPPVKPQPIYIPPTQATRSPTRPTPAPTMPVPIEREVATPKPPSTTSIQALTQQIRRLPAVLYADSRNPETRRTENLLREAYGLPLVAFYVDKIDKPKTVERHLQQLTAHKGMPYLFICGTFIGSQQHIDNYHNNKQIPQLVEYVCGDEKKRKTHKKKTTSLRKD